jgi:tight adherence protein B
MILFFIIFVPLFAITLACVGLILSVERSKQNKQIQAMLRTANPVAAERAVNILGPEKGDSPLPEFLRSSRFLKSLDLKAEQAGMEWTGAKIVMFSFAGACIGAIVSWQLPISFAKPFICVGAAAIAASLPFLVLSRTRFKRLSQFEEQFPDALDFVSRSMRAGHGFSVAMEMLVLDSPEPLASSFRRIFKEVHLGSPLEVALATLVQLVPLLDVRFFVASVLLQHETGGNLGEILSKLAHVIRERFRLKGQVKAASAHGRITGFVLLFMPIVVAIVLVVVSPTYLSGLFAEELGRKMVLFAVVGQFVGYLCIRKIVNIKV